MFLAEYYNDSIILGIIYRLVRNFCRGRMIHVFRNVIFFLFNNFGYDLKEKGINMLKTEKLNKIEMNTKFARLSSLIGF